MRPSCLVSLASVALACTEPNPHAASGTGSSSPGAESTDATAMLTGSANSGQGESITGESPACPEHEVCAPGPAEGWAGPFAVLTSSATATVPACPALYPTLEQTFRTGASVGASTCACACADPAGGSCELATVEYYRNTVGCVGTSQSQSASAACSTAVTGAAGHHMGVRGVYSGTCSPVPTVNLPEPSFAARLSLCSSAAEPGECPSGELCLPAGGPSGDAALCVVRSGTHACPEHVYVERSVHARALDDTRGCSSCTCGPPSGMCSGLLELSGLQTCVLQQVLPDGGCATLENPVGSARWLGGGSFEGSCEPSPVTAVGAAEPAEPITVCCVPE